MIKKLLRKPGQTFRSAKSSSYPLTPKTQNMTGQSNPQDVSIETYTTAV
mgnify:CR=1 FL=1